MQKVSPSLLFTTVASQAIRQGFSEQVIRSHLSCAVVQCINDQSPFSDKTCIKLKTINHSSYYCIIVQMVSIINLLAV